MRFLLKEIQAGMLVGARGWIRLKVFDGTEVVRHHFWLLCIKSEKLERIPGSRASWGSPRGGASVCLPERGAERLQEGALG